MQPQSQKRTAHRPERSSQAATCEGMQLSELCETAPYLHAFYVPWHMHHFRWLPASAIAYTSRCPDFIQFLILRIM